ncbi:MAG: ubiquinone biosynthesis protein [Verrucomicrobiales bacterium]|jgi:ubiquinone biosynthesis protein
MPSKLSQILDTVANNDLRINVDAIDERSIVDGFQKIANRITVGIILGSTIMGAAMMMQVETRFTLLGYPGIAIIFFLFAAIGGFGLACSIIFKDR